jgi:hypothetical protein
MISAHDGMKVGCWQRIQGRKTGGIPAGAWFQNETIPLTIKPLCSRRFMTANWTLS